MATQEQKFSLTRPIYIYKTTTYSGDGGRKLVMNAEPKELADFPAALFKLKVSQSKNPEKAGKIIFKYFRYKGSESTPWSDMAPTNFTMDTPFETIKEQVVSSMGTNPNIKTQFDIKMPGNFANIDTSDGIYTIFDYNVNPEGDLGYYFIGGTTVTVTFTPSTHRENFYYRLHLAATDKRPEEIFRKSGKGRIFGEEDKNDAHGASGTGIPEWGQASTPASQTFGNGVSEWNPSQATNQAPEWKTIPW